MRILGIIPAREGSKRVPQKNFRPFAGTTLTELAIQHALGSNFLTQIALTSDSETVLKIGRAYPQIACLKRPLEISGDDAPAIDYVVHALSELETTPSHFDIIVLLQPSSPLRLSEDIDATIQLLMDNPEADSAVSVVKINHLVHPVKMKVLKGRELAPYWEDERGRFAAQDLPPVYVRNGAVYVCWRKTLELHQGVIGIHSLAYEMPSERSVDINELIDFEFAEYLYGKTYGPVK